MGEGVAVDEENWKRGLRARVTALKCHVMASQGLTPQGQIVPPYNPEVLLKEPQNAVLLQQYNKPKEVKAYVAAAMQKKKRSDKEGGDSLHPNQVELEMVDGSPEEANAAGDVLVPEDAWPPIEETHTSYQHKTGVHDGVNGMLPSHAKPCDKSVFHNNKPSSDTSTISYASSSLDSQRNNNDLGKSLEMWQQAVDSEEEDDSPEANGYIRVSAEGDEFDVLSDDNNSSAPTSPRKRSGSGNGNSGSAIAKVTDDTKVNRETAVVTTDYVCDNRLSCKCCVSHAGDVAKLTEKVTGQQQEIERLGSIRDEVENELQELTANLFQEAHSMVTEANQRTAAAEKNLTEAKMAVEVLTGEVTALKAMVITSTPAAPNPHLHPQLHSTPNGGSGAKSAPSSNSNGGQSQAHESLAVSCAPQGSPFAPNSTSSLPINVSASGLRIFQRGHKKSPSDFDLKYGRDTTPPSSPLKGGAVRQGPATLLDTDCWEVDPVCHREFVAWHQSGELFNLTDPFLRRVYEEDMTLCLSFPNTTLSHALERAVQNNDIFIEEVNARHQHAVPSKCVLLGVARFCKYRFRLGSKEPFTWYYISQLARNRVIAVCDFLNYLRYIKQGLVKSSIHDMYWEVVKLRRQMALARLGF